MFIALGLASVITTGGLVLNLTENFGTLAHEGDVLQEASGNRLVGTYGNAVTGMSAVSVALSGLFLCMYIAQWYRSRGSRDASFWRVHMIIVLLSAMLGVASAGVNLNLTTNYGQLQADGNLESDPAAPVPGQNYKLRGAYGTATLGMAAASVGVAGLAFLWMMRIWIWGGAVGTELNVLGMGAAAGIGSRSKRMTDFSTL
jgi:hypothetical protein